MLSSVAPGLGLFIADFTLSPADAASSIACFTSLSVGWEKKPRLRLVTGRAARFSSQALESEGHMDVHDGATVSVPW